MTRNQTQDPPDAGGDDGGQEADALSIAVIGMAGRFPQGPDLAAWWDRLAAGLECVERFDDALLRAAGVPDELLRDPAYVRAAPRLAGIDGFDAAFFGMPPREAEITDPQQRLFLELAWHAMEDAGYGGGADAGAVGVFAGCSASHYLVENLLPHPQLLRSTGRAQLVFANDKDFLATRVAHALDLRGPALTVQTACSTSLVAVHLACQSLLAGESDMALAGGVALNLADSLGYLHTEGGILSRDGHCRPFDAQASGTLGGSGAGIVVLKPLAHALRDGDTIRAVIRGSAVNNDGADKVGFTAPSVNGQAAVIGEAQAAAGLGPQDISYVEAHGTGTALGDPIEIRALAQVFAASGAGAECAIGSVKGNMGHLDAAAGVAGLIKTVLALQHGTIPASLHFTQPNPHIDFAATPLRVAAQARAWPRVPGRPRRAGVSSFGIGGTNAHVVVEEAPLAPAMQADGGPQLLVLSATSAAALQAARAGLRRHLAQHEDCDLADAAWTLQRGRRAFAHRAFVVCADRAQALAALDRADAGQAHAQGEAARPVFLFPGQGAQRVHMARGLYARHAVFRAVVDDCAARLQPLLGTDLRALLYPPAGQEAEAARRLDDTRFTQPALFTVEYALARQMQAWGIAPAALAGHSLGEYVAACVAGVLSLPDVLRVVAARGRLLAELPPGRMLAVHAAHAQVAPLLAGEPLWLAAVNGERACTVAGTPEAVERLAAALARQGVDAQPLPTSHAFHSGLVEPVLERFRAVMRGVALHAPRIPCVSNVTGSWLTPAQAQDPDYWVRHLREPVLFADGLRTLLGEPRHCYVELGPGRALAGLLRQAAQDGSVAVASVLAHSQAQAEGVERDGREDGTQGMLRAVGMLWARGADVDWAALHEGRRRRRVPLPGYPFEHRSFWVGSRRALAGMPALPGQGDAEPQVQTQTPVDVPAQALGFHARPADMGPVRPAQTPVQAAVCHAWEEALGIAPIGIGDDFFALGGHSLLATQVMARLRAQFGVELPLRALFDAPTAQALAARVEQARGASEGSAAAAAIVPVERSGELPLSFAQQRLWFLQQIEPDNPFYNMTGAVRLAGRLDESALERALQRIVQRHEVLRTRFVSDGGQVHQVIEAERPLVVERQDFSAAADAWQRMLQQAQAEAARPFDLQRDHLLRVKLLQLGEDDHVAVVSMHHIVSDGWSMGVLIREVGALYAAYASGEPEPLRALPIQYADYASWQRSWLQGEELQRQQAYWSEQLKGAPALLSLPTDRPRPAVQSYRGGMHDLHLDEAVTQQLHDLARRSQATLFMVLNAALAVLLARYSGQDDILIGSPIANRRQAEVEPLIGFFVNTLVLRTKVRPDDTVSHLLQQVRDTTLGAYAHQDLPFEQLVELMNPERSLAHSPLFQVMLILQNAPQGELALPGLLLQPVALHNATTKFDLRIACTEREGGLHAAFEYATDLFDAATVARMARHFECLLRNMASHPDAPVRRLAMLTPAERAERLAAWNVLQPRFTELSDTQLAVPLAHDDVLDLFAAAVRAGPQRCAIAHVGQMLTYAELDAQSDAVAAALLEAGAQPGDVAGLLLQDRAAQIVATLGALKAGCVFAAFDAGYPRQRLRDMLDVARPRWMVSEAACAALLEALAQGRDAPPVPVWADRPRAHAAAPRVRRQPGDACYIYFTSGSTGRPKAVLGRTQGLAHFVQWEIGQFGLDADSRASQLTNPGFDVWLRDVFAPLCAGGAVCIPPGLEVLAPHRLAAWIEDSGVTLVHCVPSVFRLLLQAPLGPQSLPRLRHVLLAGEPLLPADANRWIALFGARTRLVNLYGPTETTLAKFFHVLPAAPLDTPFVPIGRPMPGAQAILLRPDSEEPCAPGEVGEIHLRTPYRSLGYLGEPALTDAAFVPNPFTPDPADRLYRTGDLALVLPSGDFRFMGRRDAQVKVRGMRVEPGEVDSALNALPGVREAAVAVLDDGAGGKRLAAYVVPQAPGAGAAEQRAWRAMLAERLPEHMVPAHLVLLDALPRSPNGKLDRAALPAPAPEAEYEAPQGATEEALAAIWREVLRAERVGRHDDFFQLGGHSLLAAQVVSLVRERMGVALELRSLFATRTLAELAGRVDMQGGAAAMDVDAVLREALAELALLSDEGETQ